MDRKKGKEKKKGRTLLSRLRREKDKTPQYQIIGHGGVRDGVMLGAGETFTRSWTISNLSTSSSKEKGKVMKLHHCKGYVLKQTLLFLWPMPGKSVTINMELNAPLTPGWYESYWRMEGREEADFWVKFEVIPEESPEPFFKRAGSTALLEKPDTNAHKVLTEGGRRKTLADVSSAGESSATGEVSQMEEILAMACERGLEGEEATLQAAERLESSEDSEDDDDSDYDEDEEEDDEQGEKEAKQEKAETAVEGGSPEAAPAKNVDETEAEAEHKGEASRDVEANGDDDEDEKEGAAEAQPSEDEEAEIESALQMMEEALRKEAEEGASDVAAVEPGDGETKEDRQSEEAEPSNGAEGEEREENVAGEESPEESEEEHQPGPPESPEDRPEAEQHRDAVPEPEDEAGHEEATERQAEADSAPEVDVEAAEHAVAAGSDDDDADADAAAAAEDAEAPSVDGGDVADVEGSSAAVDDVRLAGEAEAGEAGEAADESREGENESAGQAGDSPEVPPVLVGDAAQEERKGGASDRKHKKKSKKRKKSDGKKEGKSPRHKKHSKKDKSTLIDDSMPSRRSSKKSKHKKKRKETSVHDEQIPVKQLTPTSKDGEHHKVKKKKSSDRKRSARSRGPDDRSLLSESGKAASVAQMEGTGQTTKIGTPRGIKWAAPPEKGERLLELMFATADEDVQGEDRAAATDSTDPNDSGVEDCSREEKLVSDDSRPATRQSFKNEKRHSVVEMFQKSVTTEEEEKRQNFAEVKRKELLERQLSVKSLTKRRLRAFSRLAEEASSDPMQDSAFVYQRRSSLVQVEALSKSQHAIASAAAVTQNLAGILKGDAFLGYEDLTPLATTCVRQLEEVNRTLVALRENVAETIFKKSSIGCVSDALWSHVFSFLDPVSLCAVAGVSKCWRRLADADEVWGPLYQRVRGKKEHRRCKLASKLPYKRLYKIHHLYQRWFSHGRKWEDVTEAVAPDLLTGASQWPIFDLAIAGDQLCYASQTLMFVDLSKNCIAGSVRAHEKVLSCVALSEDASLCVTGSVDQTVKIWDVHSLNCSQVLSGHSSAVSSVGLMGKCVITACTGASDPVRLWDISLMHEISREASYATVATNSVSDGVIYLGGSTGSVVAWDLKGQRETSVLGEYLNGPVEGLAVCGNMLAASDGSHLVVTDLRSNVVISKVDQLGRSIRKLRLDDCRLGVQLANSLNVYDLRYLYNMYSSLTIDKVWKGAFAFRREGILVGGGDGSLRKWEPVL